MTHLYWSYSRAMWAAIIKGEQMHVICLYRLHLVTEMESGFSFLTCMYLIVLLIPMNLSFKKRTDFFKNLCADSTWQ